MSSLKLKQKSTMNIYLQMILCCILFQFMLAMTFTAIYIFQYELYDEMSIYPIDALLSFEDIEMNNTSTGNISVTLANLVELSKQPLICNQQNPSMVSNNSIIHYIRRCAICNNHKYQQLQQFIRSKDIHTGFISDLFVFKHVFKSGGTSTWMSLKKLCNILNITKCKYSCHFYSELRHFGNSNKPFIFSSIRFNLIDRFLSGFFEAHRRDDMVKLFGYSNYYNLSMTETLHLWLNNILNTTNYINPHLLPQFVFLLNHYRQIVDFDYIGYTKSSKHDLYKILKHFYGDQVNQTIFDNAYSWQRNRRSAGYHSHNAVKIDKRGIDPLLLNDTYNVDYKKYVLHENDLTDKQIEQICDLLYLDIMCLPVAIPKQCDLAKIFNDHYGKDVIYQTCNGKQIMMEAS